MANSAVETNTDGLGFLKRAAIRCVALLAVGLLLVTIDACARKGRPPVARPTPPPPPAATTPATPRPQPPEPVREPTIVPPEPIREETMGSRSLEDLNRDSPLKPVFFEYDSAEITLEAQAELNTNADLLKKYWTWVVTIEGHCDERGTAEYNLALGERRAIAARNYVVSLGISTDRLRTVSYGKEFPFDPGHDEAAWARNRRAHFVITTK